MLQEYLQGYTLYEMIYFFFIYSFIGWVMETAFCSINERRFAIRGFLVGPYCPIYGFGMCFIILLLPPSMSWQNVYLGGVLIATALEYVTGWLLETLFHTKWWDYSEHRYNLHGRVSLFISLVWGILALLIVKIVQPVIASWVVMIPETAGKIILICLLLLFMVDTVYSVIVAVKMSNRIIKRDELRERLQSFVETIQEADLHKAVKEKLENRTLSEQLAIVKEHLQTNAGQWKEKQREQWEDLQKRWEQSRYRLFEQRLRNAFPHLQPKERKKKKDPDD